MIYFLDLAINPFYPSKNIPFLWPTVYGFLLFIMISRRHLNQYLYIRKYKRTIILKWLLLIPHYHSLLFMRRVQHILQTSSHQTNKKYIFSCRICLLSMAPQPLLMLFIAFIVKCIFFYFEPTIKMFGKEEGFNSFQNYFFHESNHNKIRVDTLLVHNIYFIRHKCSIHKISTGHRNQPQIFPTSSICVNNGKSILYRY